MNTNIAEEQVIFYKCKLVAVTEDIFESLISACQTKEVQYAEADR